MNKAIQILAFIILGCALMNAQTPTFEKYLASDAALQVTGFANDGSRVVVKDTLLSDPVVIGKIVRKIDTGGQHLWSVFFRGNTITAGITANQFLTDENGNVYMLGRVKGTVYYNGDSLKSDFNNAGNVLLVKFTGSGSIAWKWQSVHNDALFAADDEAFRGTLEGGNIFIGGNSKGRNISFGSFSFPQSQYNSMNKVFVARFDTDGDLKWATIARNGNMYINSIDTDDAGNVYYGGLASGGGTLDFGNGVNMAVSENSHFVAKYNGNGEAQLAKVVVIGRTSSECKSASVDGAGNMYVAGYNDWPSAVNGITTRAHVSYIVKLDNAGIHQWTRTFTATWKAEGVQNAKCVNGKLYFTANPVANGAMYVQSGATDSISKSNKGIITGVYSSDGVLEWSEQGLDPSVFNVSSSASIIETSPDKSSLFFGGTFGQAEKFGSLILPAPGAVGTYHHGYIQLSIGTSTGADKYAVNRNVALYPNPVSGQLIIDLREWETTGNGQTRLTLFDLQGKEVLAKTVTDAVTSMNAGNLKPGIYLLKLETPRKYSVSKLIVQ